ncbi:flagellar filament capping protein FliD [Porphyrobacter sp. YT40]|uniref:flagellar filament capping protein FliD n=1 Tax=Porphyrobacter sp. YT40 TaxID=2547601 RepID=UPI0011411C01|nr:flagellar filament capping protein FliD [Porphyrobacter sp. YT40]QDH32942.1 flagellar hook protein [Porphyrobacter sp. YT40]
METAGSSIISALGAGSGVDFIKLASDISDATFAAQRNQITSRQSALEAQVSAAAQLRSAVTGLAAALGDRVRTGDLAPRGELANPAVARVSVPAGLAPRGSFSLEVTQLARSQTLLSRPLASRDALVGEGTLTLRFGTVDGTNFAPDAARAGIDITVTATDTLATLASKISQATGGDVQAYVATGTGGAQLVMKGREGAANGFVLEASGAGGGAVAGDLEYLGWSPATNTTQLQQTARDAALTLDGVAMTSPTNRITGLPGGFTLDLTGTNIGAPTTLSFGTSSAAITSVMEDFVAALNDIVGQVADLAAPIGGELGNDPGARELRRDLSGLSARVVMPGATGDEPRTLADLGLALNRDGTFRLDSARLTRALETTPDAVAAMFTTGVTGVFATMDRFARENSLISDPGTLGGSLRRYESQLAASAERLSDIAEQQEALRERLTRQFTASERRVAASQTTLDFLRQQVDIWSARDR